MTRRIQTILTLILLMAAVNTPAFAQTKIPTWPHAHGVVLPAAQAKILSKQCSRPSLPNIQASWRPSARQIARMEQKLDAYLTQHYPAIRQQIDQVYFQYAGLIRQRQRFIYINAIDEYAHNNPDWRHTAMVICDGGARFWGLEYDPATEQFSEMKFNSSM